MSFNFIKGCVPFRQVRHVLCSVRFEPDKYMMMHVVPKKHSFKAFWSEYFVTDSKANVLNLLKQLPVSKGVWILCFFAIQRGFVEDLEDIFYLYYIRSDVCSNHITLSYPYEEILSKCENYAKIMRKFVVIKE